jgi:hypothetical protein
MYMNENDLRNVEARRKQFEREVKHDRLVREVKRDQRDARKSELRQSANALSRLVSLFL